MAVRANILFFALALILTLIFFKGMGGDEFFFLHDEFLILSKNESQSSFFLHDANNLGTPNITPLLVNFFDRIYYNIFYYFDSGVQEAQQFLFFLKLFLLLALPYVGFQKLTEAFFGNKKRSIWVLCVSLWYAFNTFTLIYWNNNGFSLTLLLCYALAPLATYYLHRAFFETAGISTNKVKAVLLVYIMSFALPLFLAFLLFIFAYVVIYGILAFFRTNRVKDYGVYDEAGEGSDSVKFNAPAIFETFFSNTVLLVVLYLPFAPTYLLLLYGMISVSGPTMYLTGGETYGNLKGGILYQMLMWFSWGIYTDWKPRSIFTFSDFFRAWHSLVAPFLLYSIIVYGIYKKNLKNIHFLTLFGVLLIFFALVKGAQDPFGAVYLYLLDHSSIFRAFRSPDSKFGFVIVLTFATLLLFALKQYQKNIFVSILAAVVLAQSWPLFTGVAIRGENSDHSYDRVVHISESYRELASFLNDDTRTYGSVVTVPSAEFGLFQFDKNDRFIGQDLLSKLVRLPFVRISENGSLPVSVYRELSLRSPVSFEKYPIRYYIFRNDIKDDSRDVVMPPKSFELIFQNNFFRVYENPMAPSLVQTENNFPITFQKISPVEYKISMKGVQGPEKILFHENYQADWALFPASPDKGRVLSFFGDGIFDETHVMEDDFSNSWILDLDTLKRFPGSYRQNQDGSVDIELIAYFKPQIYFYLGLTTSAIAASGYLGYLWYARRRGAEHATSLSNKSII